MSSIIHLYNSELNAKANIHINTYRINGNVRTYYMYTFLIPVQHTV